MMESVSGIRTIRDAIELAQVLDMTPSELIARLASERESSAHREQAPA